MCEQAGAYFLEPGRKDNEWAGFYLTQAATLYADWGAEGKVHQLQKHYSSLLFRSDLMRERANSALMGRSRYSAAWADSLMDFDWERRRSSTIRSGSSMSNLS
ncbi:hypothetical protein ACA910_008430 [Epithemia clementina (nom. ined.)]